MLRPFFRQPKNEPRDGARTQTFLERFAQGGKSCSCVLPELDYTAPVLVETLSIKVSKAEKNLLRREAVARKTSASVILRQALRQVLQGKSDGAPTLLDKHRHLFVDLDEGREDLSTNPVHLRNFGK